MPNPWSEQTRDEDRALEVRDNLHRNPDSSVSPQYEDHLLPDPSSEHEQDS